MIAISAVDRAMRKDVGKREEEEQIVTYVELI